METYVTPDVLRQAMIRLDEHGLNQDGGYINLKGKSACTVGHLMIAAGALVFPVDSSFVDCNYLSRFENEVDVAFRSWIAPERTFNRVTVWSDHHADAGMVRSFYEWWLAGLEATEAATTSAELVLVT